jgi:hypothetical protein
MIKMGSIFNGHRRSFLNLLKTKKAFSVSKSRMFKSDTSQANLYRGSATCVSFSEEYLQRISQIPDKLLVPRIQQPPAFGIGFQGVNSQLPNELQGLRTQRSPFTSSNILPRVSQLSTTLVGPWGEPQLSTTLVGPWGEPQLSTTHVGPWGEQSRALSIGFPGVFQGPNEVPGPRTERSYSTSSSSLLGSDSSSDSRNPRFRTRMCQSIQGRFHCAFGTACKYAHSVGDLRITPKHSKYKSRICQSYWTTGFCVYGPRCNFVHMENYSIVNAALQRGEIRKSKSPAKKTENFDGLTESFNQMSVRPSPFF